jgi:hypothetical protein
MSAAYRQRPTVAYAFEPSGDDMTDVLFVRKDGAFAVAHINGVGELVETHLGDDATLDWTHLVPVA